jgi:hypothetical protein
MAQVPRPVAERCLRRAAGKTERVIGQEKGIKPYTQADRILMEEAAIIPTYTLLSSPSVGKALGKKVPCVSDRRLVLEGRRH